MSPFPCNFFMYGKTSLSPSKTPKIMVEMTGPCCSDKQLPSAEPVVLVVLVMLVKVVFMVLFIYYGYLKKKLKKLMR